MMHKHYQFSVVWSDEDQEWVATVAQMRSLSFLHRYPVRALEGLLEVIEDFELEHRLGDES